MDKLNKDDYTIILNTLELTLDEEGYFHPRLGASYDDLCQIINKVSRLIDTL